MTTTDERSYHCDPVDVVPRYFPLFITVLNRWMICLGSNLSTSSPKSIWKDCSGDSTMSAVNIETLASVARSFIKKKPCTEYRISGRYKFLLTKMTWVQKENSFITLNDYDHSCFYRHSKFRYLVDLELEIYIKWLFWTNSKYRTQYIVYNFKEIINFPYYIQVTVLLTETRFGILSYREITQ